MNKLFKDKVHFWAHQSYEVAATLSSLLSSLRPLVVKVEHSEHPYLVTNELRLPDAPLVDKNSLTLLSWNVFKGIHGDRLFASFNNILATHRPDIITLQEAPMYPDGSHLPWPANLISHAVYHSNAKFKKEDCYDLLHSGQLSASPFRYDEAASHLLSKVSTHGFFDRTTEYLHRSVQHTSWTTPAGRLGVYNVHLENMTVPSGRLVQVKELLDIIARNNEPIGILTGDFNTFMGRRLEPAIHLLEQEGFQNLFRTGPRWLPRLDYVFVRGAKNASAVPVFANGSDHYPTIARIELV